jgi:copper chaperone CopZ
MKIKVESEKIIKAVKKLDGIEVVVENTDDAKEAINLILRKTGIFDSNHSGKLRDFKVSAYQKYETSAVDYKMIFLLEFLFEEDASLDSRVTVIKGLQEFFDKV